ncbi:protein IQ-DOMAIN 5-like isoform X2 [Andrographis paniculata]|nr:protein IQ-DOMAIN 5-like isoform X2 [Andrographis paniculata]XP_051134481.1 protein IQ-DOMAIN 5-like isoform X2 [Andrographis paniculata]
MGASKKWIKTVLGLQKANKMQSSEEDEMSSGSSDEIWHQRKDSVDLADSIIGKEFDPNVVAEAEGARDGIQSMNHSDGIDSGIDENETDQNLITEAEDAKHSSILPMKQSGEIDHGMFENKSDPFAIMNIENAETAQPISTPASSLSTTMVTVIQDANNANLQFVLSSDGSCSTSLQVGNVAQIPQYERKEWAAINIQAAFRRFMARRSLRALRGLVRLQALATSRAVRKQATITFHSMQDLVRVQARIRARRVRMGIENQIAQQKLQQKIEQEARVKETVKEPAKETVKEPAKETEGSGWCGSVRSAEEIKAKSEKRKEAAAKREKAIAYALARQWQATPKQRTKSASAGIDKIYWSWNWSDSWMVSSQWENRAIEINLEDGTKEPSDAQPKPAPRLASSGRKMVRCSTIKSDPGSPCSSSPIKSPHLREISSPRTPTRSPRASPRTPTRSPRAFVRDSGEVLSPRSFAGARSRSTPKERSPLGDNQGKKRLSLPDDNGQQGVQTANQFSRLAVKKAGIAAPKPVNTRTKSNGEDVHSSNLSPQTVH